MILLLLQKSEKLHLIIIDLFAIVILLAKWQKYINNAYYEALLMYKIILKRLTYLSKSHFMIVTS